MNGSEFFSAMDAMSSLAGEEMLTDTSVGPSDHNSKAKILRHGLSVSAFASLEKHLEYLFQDFMSSASSMQIPFRELPDGFRAFVTIESLAGFQTRMNFLDRQDKLPFAEAQMGQLTGFLGAPVRLNAFGFSPRGSNVVDDDIRKALAALGVKEPWVRLTSLTHSVGAGRVSLKDDFRNLASTRHKSAHNPVSNIPSQDLKDNIEAARLIAIVVAATLRSLRLVYQNARTASELALLSSSPSPVFRFLDRQADGSWLERKELTGIGIKRYPDIAAAKAVAGGRRDGSYVIVRGVAQTPLEIG